MLKLIVVKFQMLMVIITCSVFFCTVLEKAESYCFSFSTSLIKTLMCELAFVSAFFIHALAKIQCPLFDKLQTIEKLLLDWLKKTKKKQIIGAGLRGQL